LTQQIFRSNGFSTPLRELKGSRPIGLKLGRLSQFRKLLAIPRVPNRLRLLALLIARFHRLNLESTSTGRLTLLGSHRTTNLVPKHRSSSSNHHTEHYHQQLKYTPIHFMKLPFIEAHPSAVDASATLQQESSPTQIPH
jgi:hypothetical protein